MIPNNNTSSCEMSIEWHLSECVLFVAQSLVLLLIVGGNALIVMSILGDRRLRQSPTNLLLVSLAVSDLLLGLLILPLVISQQVLRGDWLLGGVVCRLWLAADVWLCTASIYNLLAISYDRFKALTSPLQYKLIYAQKTGPRLVAAAWLVSFVVCAPKPLIDLVRDAPTMSCSCESDLTDTYYLVYSAAASFFVPLVIMIYLNIRILRVTCNIGRIDLNQTGTKSTDQSERQRLKAKDETCIRVYRGKQRTDLMRNEQRKHLMQVATQSSVMATMSLKRVPSPIPNRYNKRLRHSHGHIDETAEPALAETTLSTSVTSDGPNTNNQISSVLKQCRRLSEFAQRAFVTQTTEVKVAKTVLMVVLGFCVCWTPFFVMYLLHALPPAHHPAPKWFSTCTWLGYCNSAFNPFIYAVFSRDIRAAFIKTLKSVRTCCCRRCMKSDIELGN